MAWGSISIASVAYGLGLLGITERVRELCGQLSIQSELGKGTRISVVLPLKRENAAPEKVVSETTV